jgi:hypothetical protein
VTCIASQVYYLNDKQHKCFSVCNPEVRSLLAHESMYVDAKRGVAVSLSSQSDPCRAWLILCVLV